MCHQAMWLLLAMSSTFGLHLGWLLICVIAVALNGANVMGYIRSVVDYCLVKHLSWQMLYLSLP